ncbi:RNA polymerase sigma-70 factor [Kribbella deserti]|uniref:RNA polymerase sigma-70 factor n=1 Tax=Kribbella deserti TaxID=1926257 RepID=A0ABV6QUE2_9ACTN
MVTNALDEAAEVFGEVRPRLFGIAYRVLGSSAEAEDVVQDTWLRWQAYERETVRDPVGFLVTTTTRLAINVARSARVRRESYVGPWLPEPVDTSADPALGAERGEALEMAVLMLLERLSPTQRAAYVLREAFAYPYDQIAEVIQSTEANARQLVSRARKQLTAEQPERVAPAEHRRLLTAFLAAARAGDLPALEKLLAADVISYSDGGGLARATKFPVVGRDHVSKFVRAFHTRFWADATITWVEANGRAAVLLRRDGTPYALVTISATTEGVDRLMWLLNPEKLEPISASGVA